MFKIDFEFTVSRKKKNPFYFAFIVRPRVLSDPFKFSFSLKFLRSLGYSVMATGQPAVPVACDFRLFISWLTVSATHMNNSHLAADDFYHNRTQCIVSGSNGTNTTVDYTEPIQFDFN